MDYPFLKEKSRGISSIITIILLLLIVIVFTGAFIMFSTRIMLFVSNISSEKVNITTTSMQSCLKFESASANNIYVRNCGPNHIANSTLSLYVDSSPVAYSIPRNIGPDELGTIVIMQNITPGKHDIKISGGGYDIIENVWITGGSVTTTTSSTTTSSLTTTTRVSGGGGGGGGGGSPTTIFTVTSTTEMPSSTVSPTTTVSGTTTTLAATTTTRPATTTTRLTTTTVTSPTTTTILTTTTFAATTTTRTTTTITPTTTTIPSCVVGQGYTFPAIGIYTANSSNGMPSISRIGQYTFFETSHDYIDLLTCAWSGIYTCPGGSSIRFYLRLQTESGYDFFQIRNNTGGVYFRQSGDYGSSYVWTPVNSSRTASFRFVSDQYIVDWGVDVYQIECVMQTSTTTTVPGTTTTMAATTTTRISTTTTRMTTTTAGGTTTTINPSSHPYMLFHNIAETPGYANRDTYPWNTWEYYTTATADTCLDWNFAGDLEEAYDRIGYRSDYAQYLGLAYQITKNTAYAEKAKQALLNMDRGYELLDYDRAWAVGGYSLAYDWVQPYLDASSNNIIRDKLATLADNTYIGLNYNGTQTSYIAFADLHGRSYPLMGLPAVALSDYTNPNNLPLHSMPSDWLNVATEYIFVNDELHNYDQPLIDTAIDRVTGKNLEGAYKAYVMDNFALWFQVYSHYYGQNIMDRYPMAKKMSISEVWESLPNLYHNNYVTSGNTKELFAESVVNLFDSETKSNVLNHLDLIKSYDILPYSTEVGSVNFVLGYCTYQDYSSVPRNFPTYTSYLNKDAAYQVFRSNWSTSSDWMSLVTFNLETGSNRNAAHHDQLGFEYYSRGDLLMADGGEVKYTFDAEYGQYEIFHNTVAFENPRSPFSTSSWGNSQCRGIFKGREIGLETNISFNNLIQTPWFEALDMGANVRKLVNADWSDSLTLSSPINYRRTVLFPNKEYFIVTDRMEGTESWIYRNVFRFTSLNTVPTEVDENMVVTFAGNVKGNLSINNVSYNWLSLPYKTETATGITTNSIKWNTTNPYNAKVYLQLYSVPASEVKVMKKETRIGGYDYRSEVYSPILYFRTGAQNNLYRVTALLPRYATEEEKIPAQITVTGNGNAMKVSTSSFQDYIYTGKGTSSFDQFSTDADTLYFRTTPRRSFTLLNGTYVNYAGSVLSMSQKADYFTIKNETTKTSFKIKSFSSIVSTIYNIGSVSSMTMDGSAFSNWYKDGNNIVITSPSGEHYFEINP